MSFFLGAWLGVILTSTYLNRPPSYEDVAEAGEHLKKVDASRSDYVLKIGPNTATEAGRKRFVSETTRIREEAEASARHYMEVSDTYNAAHPNGQYVEAVADGIALGSMLYIEQRRMRARVEAAIPEQMRPEVAAMSPEDREKALQELTINALRRAYPAKDGD